MPGGGGVAQLRGDDFRGGGDGGRKRRRGAERHQQRGRQSGRGFDPGLQAHECDIHPLNKKRRILREALPRAPRPLVKARPARRAYGSWASGRGLARWNPCA